MTNSSDNTISAWKTVRLVARREVRTRVRSKSFVLSTAAVLLLIVALSVVMRFVADDKDVIKVAVTPSAATLGPMLTSAADAVDRDIALRVVDDIDGSREQVQKGDLDVLVSSDRDRLRVVVKSELDSRLKSAFESVAQRTAAQRQLQALGGDAQSFEAAIAAAGVDVQELDPPREYNSEQLALGAIAGILIYMALMFTGQAVAQGVVEEKSSRVVEVLLATVRASELMAGKVLGIGLVGLIQVLVLGGGGVLAGLLTGALTISASTASASLLWLIIWFILGYSLYALAFAAAGALVSRQEDVGGVVSPVMMLLVVGYVIGISVLPSDPGNKLCEVLSMVPVFAPMLMPMRLAMGGVPAWQAALSVGLTLLMIPLLVFVSGRIYRRAIVRTGGRVKLSEALR